MNKSCSIDDCEKPAVARSWCPMHWARWRRNGDPLHVQRIREDDEARFWSHVEKGSDAECWPWTGSLDRHGYGRMSALGEVLAHRVAYRLFVGDIPAGLVLDHVAARGCVRRDCVNPAHLEPVTEAENVLRGSGPSAVNATKTHCPSGHEYDEANTIRRNGRRHCRACEAT